jgi:prevent-host-death family protein
MKRAKVSELKARLSAYLKSVRNGETVVVLDRLTPIARLVPIEPNADDFVIEEPRRPASELRKIRPIQLRKKQDVVKLLRESRDQR